MGGEVLMDLNHENLTVKREKVYFFCILIIALIAWMLIVISIVGLVIGLLIAFFIWLANGLMVARLKTEAVKIDEKQLPDLYSTYMEVCQKLQLVKIPDLYIVQSSGLLNAFATRHAGRDFVVLYSDIVEAYDQKGDEIRFLLGHEIGHVKSRHLFKHALLFPGMILPLVGPGYSRACEASCDRFGAFACNGMDGAIKALMILFGGKSLGNHMDPVTFSSQYQENRGFFVSWHEIIWPYPSSSERVAQLVALRENNPVGRYSRHPLAYLFGFFTFGIQQLAAVYIVFLIAMFSAIAIPNVLRAKIVANDAYAKNFLIHMHTAADAFAQEHNGAYPQDAQALFNYAAEKDSSKKLINECGNTKLGYVFSCEVNEKEYTLTATPITKGTTGTDIMHVSSHDVQEEAEAQESVPAQAAVPAEAPAPEGAVAIEGAPINGIQKAAEVQENGQEQVEVPAEIPVTEVVPVEQEAPAAEERPVVSINAQING